LLGYGFWERGADMDTWPLFRRVGGRGSPCRRASKTKGPLMGSWPLPQSSDWADDVNLPQTEAELEAIDRCSRRGSPYGNTLWTERTAEQLGLQSTLRPRGRPRKVFLSEEPESDSRPLIVGPLRSLWLPSRSNFDFFTASPRTWFKLLARASFQASPSRRIPR
jgi:hypothetical protein